MASSREKIEESFALLNSLWASTQDASSSASTRGGGENTAGGYAAMATSPAGRNGSRVEPAALPSSSSSSSSLSIKTSIFPPTQRAPVLDKLARFTAKRPSLKDSIAASITASASISNRVPGQSQPFSPITASASSSSPRTKPNRYMPWSREQFHERLSTFKPSTWFDKPQLVNPVECAKYGWVNKGDDRLECFGGCGGVAIMRAGMGSTSTTLAPTAKDTESNPVSEVVPNDMPQDVAQDALKDVAQDIPKDVTHEVTQDVTQDGPQDEALAMVGEDDMSDVDLDTEAFGPKFHALLTSCHAKACPWKNHPCDDNIYKFPVLSRTQARDEYMQRLKSLATMKDDPLVTKIHHPLVS
ncbi:Nuclear-interacting partner of ALK [Actinomortierella ambigua]|nr:Nuclear-interacting partner of ALK [Actinomortierella ambigua]